MRHIEFSAEELKVIHRDRFHHPDPHVQKWMEVLWLKAHGEKHQRIATLVGLGRATVQRVLDRYLAGGLTAVQTREYNRPASALTPYQDRIKQDFLLHPPHTVAEACDRIEKLTGVRRKPSRVREFLRDHLDLRWRKVAAVPMPPGKTPQEHAAQQADFLKDGVAAPLGRGQGRQAGRVLIPFPS